MEDNNNKKIAELNDLLRSTFLTGRVVFTDGVTSLQARDIDEIITKVREFNDFTEDNDPYGEHDFGKIDHKGNTIFWKIDYYDKACEYGSEDPTDPKQTTRVLTIMLADEY